MPKEDRRLQLIETALGVFSERGFAETTTKEIATAAGISEGIIYHHFPTKEALYCAILDHVTENEHTEEWLHELHVYAEHDDDEGLVRCLVSKILESYRDNRGYHRMMLFASLRGHTMAQLANERLGQPIFDFLQDYVRRRQADAVFREGEPALLVLGLVGTPVYYSMVTSLFGVSAVQSQRTDEDLVEHFATTALHGLVHPQLPKAQGRKVRRKEGKKQ